jgi:hypothetical protein
MKRMARIGLSLEKRGRRNQSGMLKVRNYLEFSMKLTWIFEIIIHSPHHPHDVNA